jgi:arylsulfatase A-like enzyme
METKEKLPSIVFIMADDMGYGDVECYNPESLIPTPHIDRLATEGTRFTQAHLGCVVCTPTSYALMTGRYQWRTSKGDEDPFEERECAEDNPDQLHQMKNLLVRVRQGRGLRLMNAVRT